MVEFEDGPAAGHSLMLSRAPELLRVVVDSDGTVDALDQLDDQPTATETVYAYYRTKYSGHGFACTRGKGCRAFVSATYRLVPSQPEDAILRDTSRWQAWCLEQSLVPLPSAPSASSVVDRSASDPKPESNGK